MLSPFARADLHLGQEMRFWESDAHQIFSLIVTRVVNAAVALIVAFAYSLMPLPLPLLLLLPSLDHCLSPQLLSFLPLRQSLLAPIPNLPIHLRLTPPLAVMLPPLLLCHFPFPLFHLPDLDFSSLHWSH